MQGALKMENGRPNIAHYDHTRPGFLPTPTKMTVNCFNVLIIG